MNKQHQAQQPQAAVAQEQPAPRQQRQGPRPQWLDLILEVINARFGESDAKREAAESRLDGEIKAVKGEIKAVKGEIKAAESRLDAKIEASESRQTWRVIAAVIGVQGLFFTALQIWPPGGGG